MLEIKLMLIIDIQLSCYIHLSTCHLTNRLKTNRSKPIELTRCLFLTIESKVKQDLFNLWVEIYVQCNLETSGE